ncbi:serine protease [Streptomyces lincolnensis]|uniref:Serine protease n=1 Tax=Streptomyces lincolnensis TaxID=1915 RepID=A0A1B1MNX8_STRLN|nr:serine protease [Streptomyces lincolnensis]
MKRTVRIVAAAGLVTALSATGPIPLAFATGGSSTTVPAEGTVKSAHHKLGSADAELLAEAKADGEKNVTLMIATAPGRTEQVAEQLDGVKGGSVGRTYDRLGYVRATVPVGKADSASRPPRSSPPCRASTCGTRSGSRTRRPARTTPRARPPRRLRAPTPGRTRTPRPRTLQPALRNGRRRFREEEPPGGRVAGVGGVKIEKVTP